MTILFDRYIPALLESSRSGKFKKITPIQEVHTYSNATYIYVVESLCVCTVNSGEEVLVGHSCKKTYYLAIPA